jgi:hypothetical protein
MVEVPLHGLAGKRVRSCHCGRSPKADRIQRLKSRDHRTDEEIRGILQAQWPLADKVARAHYVVENGRELSLTQQQVKIIWDKLQKIRLTAGNKKVSVPSNLP